MAYFVSCLIFLGAPPILVVMFVTFFMYNGESCLKIMKEMFEWTICVIFMPISAIVSTGANLILGDNNVVDKKLADSIFGLDYQTVTLIKLFEILGQIWANIN